MNISIDTVDIINMKLEQARAITYILMADGESNTGFKSDHRIVTSTLWAILSLIEETKQEMRKTEQENSILRAV